MNGAHAMWASAQVLEPFTLGTLPCCHSFLHWGPCQELSEGSGGPVEPPTPSSLLDDFLLGDGWLRDGRRGLDNCGDGSWQKLVGFRPGATWW